jgi:hypothetical protein
MTAEAAGGARPKARAKGLVAERVDDELVIYDSERHKGHCLNETAALVFTHCDGQRTVAELAELLSEESGQPVDEDVVRAGLIRLSDAHLLDESVSAAREGRDWSRRQVLRKIGVAGAAAGLGLPVVKSIVLPTPAQAQSCSGQQCGVQIIRFGQPTDLCLIVTVGDPADVCCPGSGLSCQVAEPGVCRCQP